MWISKLLRPEDKIVSFVSGSCLITSSKYGLNNAL
jgi:hypothetical protein